ncbi:MAG: LytTR family DNA-binding domain-containing protein [Bacteroidota bacterium]
MKVLIIEDEAPAFRRLQKVLEEIDGSIEIVEVLDSVNDSVKWLKNHQFPDLIFMDIQLSDGISFEIFDHIEVKSPVIFTTAFDEYTLRAFKVNSIDYLLKPIKKDALEKGIEKYRFFQNTFGSSNQQSANEDLGALIKQITLTEKQYKTRFLIKTGDKLLSISSDEVSHFQMRQGVVHLYTSNGKRYITDHTMDEIGSFTDPEKFFRANRQFIVAYGAIKTVHKYHKGKLLVELNRSLDDQIIVSMEKASSFKKWLGL